jgi:predicted phosphodiesterase
MRIAVIADVHGNFHSLSAVLEDAAAEKPDLVIGAGDMVGCSAYPGAVDVWHTLHSKKIPCVLGNEEERILAFHSPMPEPYLKNSVQFMPLQYRARQFSRGDIEEMKALPMSILLNGPDGQDVLICHASPCDVWRSPMEGIDAQMEQELHRTSARVIVVGHLHTQWHQTWQGKLLIMAGSGGLPLRGKPDEVDYLILTFRNQEWLFEYKTVKYDHQAAVADTIGSQFLEQAGPIGWLMLDEILTQEDRLVPFLGDYCPEKKPDDMEGWKKLVMDYLVHIKRWNAVHPYIQHLL